MVDPLTGQEIYNLFQEFELTETPESKLANALDNLEMQIQHNHADFSSWEEIEYELVFTKMDKPCSHDSFLIELCESVRIQAEEKMKTNGINPEFVKQKIKIKP